MKKNYEIGEIIRNKRRKIGMTQAELARKSGVSPSFVNRLEKMNRKGISVSRLTKIANAMNLTLLDLTQSETQSAIDLQNLLSGNLMYKDKLVCDEDIKLIKVILDNSIVEIKSEKNFQNEMLVISLEKW